MSHLTLVTASADITARVRSAVGGDVLVLAPGTDVAAHLAARPSRLLVLDAAGRPTEEALEVAARVGAAAPATAVVLVAELAADGILAAMHAGVRDVLAPTADPGDIARALGRAEAATTFAAPGPAPLAEAAPARRGRVVTVVSPKGGVGKTTVAVNLAVGLNAAAPGSTVLVDLDVQFGDVGAALDLAPEYTILDALRGQGRLDPLALQTSLTRHRTGLFVLGAPENPAAADDISGPDVGALVELLAAEFAFVVVDTAAGITDHTLSALDHTSDLVPVTSMDVPGVRALRKELDALGALGLVPGDRHTVLNFVDRSSGLAVADIEATLGTPVDVRLPRSNAVTVSVNRGVPLLESGSRDAAGAGLRSLVERFVPSPARRASRWHGGGRHRAFARAS
jgi:pilus assembly protein CpaE